MLTPKYNANHKLWSDDALKNVVHSQRSKFCIYQMEWWWFHAGMNPK